MEFTILQTKLMIPFIHSNLVHRTRLSEKINSGIQLGHKLTLVAAPAGFGKSTAVSVWAEQNKQPTTWLTLDTNDNETAVFWAYVIASIQTINPNFAENALSLLTNSPPAPISDLLPILLNSLTALQEPITLVLDDYHIIENKEIHDSISFLLTHQPPNIHLLISTRADPPLPIAQLRAKRSLTELRAEDLRFNYEEERTLLNEIMKLGLTDEEIDLLEKRTEGWGVGLLLAAQSIQGSTNKNEFISAFSGSQKYILEYLIEEVLNHQSKNIREFLLQTAFLDQFCPELCDKILGKANSHETIQQIIKSNLFIIPLDTQQIWYRYHHLFADLLSIFLKREFSTETIQQLHHKASQWYQDAGNLEEAIRYALKGQNYIEAANLIEQIIDRLIARGQVKTLLEWIRKIPEDVINSRPRLLMHQGWVVFLSGRVNQAAKILNTGKQALAALPESAEKNTLHGRLSAMLATITSLTRNIPQAIAEAQEALAYLNEEEHIYRARAARAWGVCLTLQGKLDKALEKLNQAKELALKGQNKFLASEILSQIATTRKHQGKISQARKAYLEILIFHEKPDQAPPPPACLGYIGMAEIAFEENRLAHAESYLKQGIELCQKGNIGYALQPAYLLEGLLKCAQGKKQEAVEMIEKGAALSRGGGGSLESILGLAWFQTRLNLMCGNTQEALAWAQGTILPPNWSFAEMPLTLDEMHQSLMAHAYLKNKDYDQVFEIYDRVCAQAETGGRFSRVIELNLFKAAALFEIGQTNDALPPFEKSIQLAAPEAHYQLFLEIGPSVLELIKMLPENTQYDVFITHLAAALTAGKDDSPISLLIEALTAREMEVLRLMCEGCTNQQIADTMIVSVNTIKKHTSNIYSKLGVRNRAQAVLKANELNLI